MHLFTVFDFFSLLISFPDFSSFQFNYTIYTFFQFFVKPVDKNIGQTRQAESTITVGKKLDIFPSNVSNNEFLFDIFPYFMLTTNEQQNMVMWGTLDKFQNWVTFPLHFLKGKEIEDDWCVKYI